MDRRGFLKASAAVMAAPFIPASVLGASSDEPVRGELIGYFTTILDGFLKNARATSADYTVCDFPQGTRLGSTLTPSGKSYVGVARMLPAMAEYVVGGRAGGRRDELTAVLLSIYRTAFDPGQPDYWAEPAGEKPTQRTVESSLVAMALARLGPEFVGRLSARERGNVNKWLTACTVVPERTNNHAWFTAVNQAARIKLGKTFAEFRGDEKWMLDDLDAMDVLAANAADGWYSDDPKLTVYDYYNFWTFGNFPLFWSRIAGDLYPDRDARLRARAGEFLKNTPYFFGADGAVPLFGRSLLYRWALLSPLVLGYQQGIWPYSPGMLRRIVRLNMAWWWGLGAYDATLGKLRETLSEVGSKDVTEGYIDNGHPYWCMQGFSFLSIPDNDPFWTAAEEPLPVEREDFVVRVGGPKMVLRGTKRSGQVRWLQAVNTPRRDYYRDKYNKFVWSSAFPFNVLQEGRKASPAVPWDQALVFRDPATGACAARIFPESGELFGEDGVRTVWTAKLPDGRSARVTSTVRLLPDDYELRSHEIRIDGVAERPMDLEICEGSHALGLAAGEAPSVEHGDAFAVARSPSTGHVVAAWRLVAPAGGEMTVDTSFDSSKRTNVNAVYAGSAVVTPRCRVSGDVVRHATLFYASPKPLDPAELHKRAEAIRVQWEKDNPAP